MKHKDIQTTFNEDGIDELLVDGGIENEDQDETTER